MPEPTTTSEWVAYLKTKYPCASLSRIAELVAQKTNKLVSRQRVYTILQSKGLQTTRGIKFLCPNCNNVFFKLPSEITAKDQEGLYCSPECKRDHKMILVECNYCGRLFKRHIKDIMSNLKRTGQKYIFCDRRCLGHFMAERYGFKRKEPSES